MTGKSREEAVWRKAHQGEVEESGALMMVKTIFNLLRETENVKKITFDLE